MTNRFYFAAFAVAAVLILVVANVDEDEPALVETTAISVNSSQRAQAVSALLAVSASSIDASSTNAPKRLDFYQALDAQLRENIAPPGWFYADRDLYAEVAARDRTAYVSEVLCGERVCRVTVQHEDAAARDRFAQGTAQSGRALVSGSLVPTLTNAPQSAPVARTATQTLKPNTLATTHYRYPVDYPARSILYVTKAPSQDEIRAVLQTQAMQ